MFYVLYIVGTYVSMSGLNGVTRDPRSAMPRDFPVACLSPLVPTFKTPKGVRGGFNPVRTPKTCLGAKCRLENKEEKCQNVRKKQETSRGIGNANLSAHSVIINLVLLSVYPDTLGVHGEKER